MTPEQGLALSALLTIVVTIIGWRVADSQRKQIETLRSKLEEQLHARKMTFEKEFEIYSEVWSKLVDLREATINLRPILDTIDPNEPEEERRKKRLQQFAICHNEFFSVVCKNEPFYPSEIYQRLMRIKQIATMEFSQYRISYPPRAKDWENAEKNIEKMTEAIDNTCSAIRNRIAL